MPGEFCGAFGERSGRSGELSGEYPCLSGEIAVLLTVLPVNFLAFPVNFLMNFPVNFFLSRELSVQVQVIFQVFGPPVGHWAIVLVLHIISISGELLICPLSGCPVNFSGPVNILARLVGKLSRGKLSGGL